MIKRERYLNALIDRMNNGMIKVLTGIKRCGKSFLLFNIFYNYLLEHGINDNHIIKIQLDDISNVELSDPRKLYTFIKSKIIDKDNYYVLLDEVQMVEHFEIVLN